jgi:hypothetical protein
MTRRRLILVAAVLAFAAFGAAWWQSLDRLTPEEQLIAGEWRLSPNGATGSGTWALSPGRQCHMALSGHDKNGNLWTTSLSGRWSVRRGAITVDGEGSPVRRALRPVYRLLGWPTSGPTVYTPAFVTSDEMVIVGPDGALQVWTRATAD